MTNPTPIDRPPRIQPELPFGEIDIPKPPDKRTDGWMRVLQVALPTITILGYILMSAFGGMGRNPWFMIPMALSVVASVIFSLYTYQREKQEQARQARKYTARLVELNKAMLASHEQQRRFYTHNYPEVTTAFHLAETAYAEAKNSPHLLRSQARLWERRTEDADFGVLRLGMGALPSTVVYAVQDADPFTDDPQLRAAMKVADDSRFVPDIPVILSLRQPPEERKDDEPGEREEEAQAKEQQVVRTPYTHALALAGDRQAVYGYARALLSHFVVFHSPLDTRVYGVAQKDAEWRWATALPHSQGEHTAQWCFLNAPPDAEDAVISEDEEETPYTRFLEGIRRTLAQRKLQLEERDDNSQGGLSNQAVTLPFLLLVVDLMDAAYHADSPLKEIEADSALSILLENGGQLGAAVIFLTPDRSKAPSQCTAVVEIEHTTPPSNRKSNGVLSYRYAEVGVNTVRYLGAADTVDRVQEMSKLAQRLAECSIRRSAGADIAAAVPFLELMNYKTLQALQVGVVPKWRESITAPRANWLRTKIGMLAGNKPRTLIFSAKRDGVHGMVAGSTGSGKSELLISLIMGLALQYDPTVVNFVLVDYKGGSAFDALRDLPHCVDLVTNLNANGVTRMFTAINSELKRRQALNTDTDTKDIVEYRQKGLHVTWPDGSSGRPYPFLFIVIDEFAEMIADRTEFRGELESITRVGRAQGVHLLLAAQRPTGVTEQMRSNIKYRICLRVETPAESRELLRRPDAAFLPGGLPGRGFLQIGNDEVEMIQIAYAGGAYRDPAPVLWPDRKKDELLYSYRETPELYRVLIRALAKVARDEKRPRQRAPWPDFLPESLALTQVLASDDDKIPAITSWHYLGNVGQIAGGQPAEHTLSLNPALNKWLNGEEGWSETPGWAHIALRPVVGLVDDPFAARQIPLVIDLAQGHAVLIGGSGWGKTLFVRTLSTSLAANHSPDRLHLYLLDLGGRNLNALEALPHVGSVISTDDEGYEERVAQLFRDVGAIVARRKDKLAAANVTSLHEYNDLHPDDAQPALVIIIDNFVEFRETFDSGNDEIEDVFDQFVDLARRARAHGVHFVVTAHTSAALPQQVFNLFSERLVLRLNDPSEYRAIVPGAPEPLPEIAGRGYVKIGVQALTFQIARPFDLGQTGITEAEELAIVGRQMHAFMQSTGRRFALPIRIDPLPTSLLFKRLLARLWALEENKPLLDQVRLHTAQRWQAGLAPHAADWPAVPLGVVSGNRPRTLYLEAKRDGVHGLLAGGTGSGKSELLMTMIVSFALHYDPSILNFVLVDFKGGGAFLPFEKLPHVVDVVTNLHKSGVQRMFTAISAELQRRQELNTRTRTKDIVEYRTQGFHLHGPDGAPGIPYPHLFVIIDEYAEMIASNPEFKDALDSITRTGRAQGVHLLLAAQRPLGVTDQMRANIKYRICLRVEEVDTSREMLRRPDAAFLPNGMPGRGYLQIGNDAIELMQVAYTGEDYTDLPDDAIREGARQPKFYDVIVDLAQDLLRGERPRRPWPPPLPASWRLVAPLSVAYWGAADARQVTLGRRPITSLNPYVQDWLEGRGAWPGVDWETQAMRGVVGLVDDPQHARQLPLVIDFARGHAVIFGASGYGKTTLLRTLVASLAATHTPAEFQAHILDLGGRSLDVLKELPHVGSLIIPDERGYEERVDQLLRELDNVLEERKRRFGSTGVSSLFEYNLRTPADQLPAILVAVDSFSVFIETFGGKGGMDDSDSLLNKFVALTRQAKAYGIHCVITVNRLGALPTPIYSLFTERLTLRLAETDDYRAIVGGSIPGFEETPGRGYVKVGRDPLEFQVALIIGQADDEAAPLSEADTIRAMARAMHAQGRAHWRKQLPFRIEALPKLSDYRQVLSGLLEMPEDATFVGGLYAGMQKRWQQTREAESADWLQFVLGITAGNRPRTLHLEAKRDGVHGLIAGGTGSGKSELLMTMIVGMVVNYDPSILNLVLVDYKGGGAFKPFETLPHVVDIVTNLNKAAVHRMFTAIGAEMRRRQQLNADTRTKDIIDYRTRGLHLTGAPFPHLFIIIDEYAEMIDDNPEYKAELESITRVGRSIGVNLILASQRPKGVTDQMRANIKLRICLRVEEMDTSRELLRRPDAALLPSDMPGRGYLQIGNENIELIQVSYTGDPQPDDRPAAVVWPARAAMPPTAIDEPPKFYDRVVQLARALHHNQMAPKPWPGFLPDNFSLESTLFDAKSNQPRILMEQVAHWANDETTDLWPGVDWGQGALRATVGLVDDPAEAVQTPLTFDLSRYHLAVFGDASSGKTNLLRTLILSLAATHAPDELHLYVIDLTGRNYRAIQALPHVGTVIYADEAAYDERFSRLLDMLDRTIAERQTRLAEAGVGSLYEYNMLPEIAARLPAIVVAIDNFSELWDSQQLLAENTLAPLIRRALTAGITFVVTSSGGSMASKVSTLFGERVTLRQSNPDRYLDLVGRGAIDFGALPGRGYVRRGQRPLMFHAARPIGLLDAAQPFDAFAESAEIQRVAASMNAFVQRKEAQHAASTHAAGSPSDAQVRPDSIRILPEVVSLQAMFDEARVTSGDGLESVLGEDATLQPALANLSRLGPHFTIVGPPFSGKTTVLYNWIFSLALRYAPPQAPMILIDTQRRLFDYGGRHKLIELPHVLAAIEEVDDLVALLPRLRNECAALAEAQLRELFIFIDNFDDFSDELIARRPLNEELAQMARRFGRDGLHFVIAGSTELTSASAELRRRVQSSNYGLGLRISQTLDALRVNKRPAGIQDQELPIGRGYLVKSGAATLIQVATPYTDQRAEMAAETAAETEKLLTTAQALDGWVERVLAQHPEARAQWGRPAADSAPAANGVAPDNPFDARTARLTDLLRRIAHKRKLDDPAALLDRPHNDILLTFITSALHEEWARLGLAPVLGDAPSTEDILNSAEGIFPEITIQPEAETNGAGSPEGDASS
jgi:DNA segregation ATPase FtsK/SpoIIIE-like protein